MGIVYNRRKRISNNATLELTNRGAGVLFNFGPLRVSSRGRVSLHLGKGLTWRIFG